jgi:hypothetical protein
MVDMAVQDDRALPAGTGLPLEALLDELDCNALDVTAYLMDIRGLHGLVDAAGAACVRRRLEPLDELGEHLEDGPLPRSCNLM